MTEVWLAPMPFSDRSYRGACPRCGVELLSSGPRVICPCCRQPSLEQMRNAYPEQRRRDRQPTGLRAAYGIMIGLRRIGRALNAQWNWRRLCPTCLHVPGRCTCAVEITAAINWFGDA